MKALGVICGVGSMMIGAQRQGFDIIGNIEYRKYYDTGTFEYNFKDSFYEKSISDLSEDQLKSCEDLDLIIGHTECGGFSNLNKDKSKNIQAGNRGDIPEFVDAVKTLKPKFFVMDNLPRSLQVADWWYYAEQLPEYDIHFEWVSNYNYGNSQRMRRRLFVIGSLKSLGFYFVPGEFEFDTTIRKRLSTISPDARNNEKLDPDKIYGGWGRYQFEPEYRHKSVDENRLTLRQLQEFIKDEPNNLNLKYYNKKGEIKRKIGFSKVDIDRPALVLSGGGACFDNHFKHDDLYPFTIRERAKLQGCPDDFVFLPEGVRETNKEYSALLKQTGKFMPVEFCTYVTGQIKEFLEGRDHSVGVTGERVITPNKYIDPNKYSYCKAVGYANPDMVCKYCGSSDYCKKQSK